MRISKSLSCLALGASSSLLPSSASACSPPIVYPSEPCDVVNVWIPGVRFPVNLADTDVRVMLQSYDGITYSQQPFDPALALTVARETDDGGFEVVDYTLGTMDGLLTDARLLQITDPVPGRYLVASPDNTCEGEPVPFTDGTLLAEFDLTEEVELPAELGVATWLGQTVANEMVYLGQGADCSSVTEEHRIARSRFRLELSDQAWPWSEALRFGIEIDGEQAIGFGIGEFEEPGVLVFEHELTCPAGNAELSPGTHTLRFLGQVDSTIIASSAVDFEHTCDPSGSSHGAGNDSGTDGGCSTARGSRNAGWLLTAPLLLLAALRGRRRRR